MTDESPQRQPRPPVTREPENRKTLYAQIRRRVEAVGGFDDLELPPREPVSEPPDFSQHIDGVDLLRELLRRSIQKAEDDPNPGIPAEEIFEKLKRKHPLPEPAMWRKLP